MLNRVAPSTKMMELAGNGTNIESDHSYTYDRSWNGQLAQWLGRLV